MNSHLKCINVQIYIQLKSRTTVSITNTMRTGILETAYVLNGSQRCTVLTFVNYVCCIQDAVYQDPSHLYNYCASQ